MKLKNSLIAIGVISTFLVMSSPIFSANNSTDHSSATEDAKSGYKVIHAQELKNWMDTGKDIQIVDARPKKYDKGGVINGAKFLPFDASETLIAKELPSKSAVIVVYCANSKCPASTKLATQLIKLGYKNVYKYPEGLADWVEKKYPTSAATS